jgi:hypothetical protein
MVPFLHMLAVKMAELLPENEKILQPYCSFSHATVQVLKMMNF